MRETCLISEILANLILQSELAWRTLETAGHMIAADARLRAYPWGGKPFKGIEEIAEFYEVYEGLVNRTRVAVTEFLETRDQDRLIEVLSEIKGGLAAL
jgi:hypothetical protein